MIVEKRNSGSIHLVFTLSMKSTRFGRDLEVLSEHLKEINDYYPLHKDEESITDPIRRRHEVERAEMSEDEAVDLRVSLMTVTEC